MTGKTGSKAIELLHCNPSFVVNVTYFYYIMYKAITSFVLFYICLKKQKPMRIIKVLF